MGLFSPFGLQQLVTSFAVVATLLSIVGTAQEGPLNSLTYSGSHRFIHSHIKEQEKINNNNNDSPIASVLQDQGNDSSSSDSKSSSHNNTPTLLVILNVVLLLAIILLLMLYYNTTRKLNKMMKVQAHNNNNKSVALKEVDKDDVESSTVSEKKIEIGEGTKMTVEDRKELMFFNGNNKTRFQMGQLLRASAETLGQGTMGNSYKAMMHDGPTIVVKRLRDLKPFTEKEFATQLRVIAGMQHPNLLPLLAYYHSRDEKLLLFKYAQNGNLFSRLHEGRDGSRAAFRWNSRLCIAKSVARAMEYLHNNTKNPNIVPHGNLKTTNVLIDENDVAMVSDYGLSALIAQPIAVQRMVIYKSPEYAQSRRVTAQSDVWSYGCLLIELLTGKISACSAPHGSNGVDLCGWVHRAVREEWTAEIFDKEIYRQKNAQSGMIRLLEIAMLCTERFPENRPAMSQVVREVEKIQAVAAASEVADEDDLSADRSFTDDSLSMYSTSHSGILAD
ncbi:hypothetical protein PIB30_052845 [Stylosanthes scabra]|uniref:Protein kinase domain-containing protein n=1 Tax=Stylosanthes scabra TaxID=79078 RepID=A0ABU6RIA0_9FABA|nr:hypothetical protein [Stylosanthes scabra]